MASVKGFKAATANFQRLMEKRDDIERRAHLQRMRAMQIDAEIVKTRAAIDVLKKAKRGRGGARADLESARRAEKDIHLLEGEKNRLMIATDKLDDGMRAVRLKINEARLHRLSQDRVFSTMNKDLDEIKGSLVKHIEQSNVLLEEKEAVGQTREAVANRDEDHVLDFDANFTSLSLELEELQARQRSAFNTEQKTAMTGTIKKLSEEEKVKMELRLEQLDEWIDDGRAYIEECDRRTERLGDVFQLMMTRGGVDKLDDLVGLFRENEASKFKIYTYIQHLNREIKTEDRQLVELKAQVEDFKATHGRIDAEKRDRMVAMSEDLDHTMHATKLFTRSSETNMLTVKEMVNVAKRLANAVDSATVALEGSGKGREVDLGKPIDLSQLGDFVTEEAMTNCMGLVEQRAYHAIRMFSEVVKSDKGRDAVAMHQTQQKATRELRASSSGGRMPASPKRGPKMELTSCVTPSDVTHVLNEALKGPPRPKLSSPNNMTRKPTFTSLRVPDDDEFVPDERPMKRSELYQLAQQDLDMGSLTLESTMGASDKKGARSAPSHKAGGKRTVAKPKARK